MIIVTRRKSLSDYGGENAIGRSGSVMQLLDDLLTGLKITDISDVVHVSSDSDLLLFHQMNQTIVESFRRLKRACQ